MKRKTAILLLILAAATLAVGEDLYERVETLRREGRYELASGLLEDHLERGTPLDRSLSWLRAQLTADPDRFDRITAGLVQGHSAEDSLAQRVLLARAREAFAGGRYLTALEALEALPSSAWQRYPATPLFAGMAAAAAGSPRKARETLLLVPPSSPHYAEARTLLAQLSLRAGEVQEALRHAETALGTGDPDPAAQALYVRAEALEQSGDQERAQRTREEILRRWGKTAEAAWLREDGMLAARATATEAPGIDEVEAPGRRNHFAVQLGAFHDRGLALRLAQSLRGRSQDLRIERDGSSSPPWYRVVVGRYPTRNAAEEALADLGAEGYRGVLLAPGQG
jgi:tetratricopeptide (TPR) repeat protein